MLQVKKRTLTSLVPMQFTNSVTAKLRIIISVLRSLFVNTCVYFSVAFCFVVGLTMKGAKNTINEKAIIPLIYFVCMLVDLDYPQGIYSCSYIVARRMIKALFKSVMVC